MIITLLAALAFTTSVAVLCALDNIRVRRELRQIKQDAAEQVSNALGGGMMVDGIELPLPSDDRWKLDQMCEAQNTSKKVIVLRIGLVIAGEYDIWVALAAPNLPRTDATKKYCSDVWKAYRSRVARKSIESAQ